MLLTRVGRSVVRQRQWRQSRMMSTTVNTGVNKVALVMGVANQRSIAWACVEQLLNTNHHVVITHQDRFHDKVQSLIVNSNNKRKQEQEEPPRILGHLNCDVRTDLPTLFSEQIPKLLQDAATVEESPLPTQQPAIHTIVHSIAFGDLQKSLKDVDWETYQEAQQISAFSFLETAQCAVQAPSGTLAPSVALTALSYLGAVRAVPSYGVLGPAKAALESLVRGMALEFGPGGETTETQPFLRVNAVSAGPIATLSARGGIQQFAALQRAVSEASPLGRPVTTEEVAQTIAWISESTAITGQTIYVDGGYSNIVPTTPV